MKAVSAAHHAELSSQCLVLQVGGSSTPTEGAFHDQRTNAKRPPEGGLPLVRLCGDQKRMTPPAMTAWKSSTSSVLRTPGTLVGPLLSVMILLALTAVTSPE